MTLTFIPSWEGTAVEETDTSLSVKSIGCCQKFVIFILILLPRTVIIILLAYIGTEFLILADDYGDLILNSVALGFLIEVDDMLFSAVTSGRTKARIAKTEPLEGSHSCSSCCIFLGKLPTSIPLVLLVIGMSLLQMWKAFFIGGSGKYTLSTAYQCLCHAEGPTCAQAQ